MLVRVGRMGAVLVIAVVAASPALTRAQEDGARLRLDVEGECPTVEQLEGALRVAIGPDAIALEAPWLMLVGPDADGEVTLRLVRAEAQAEPGVAPELEREIESDDCGALAEAFAFIVQAHFVEIRLIDDVAAAPVGPGELVAPPPLVDPRPPGSATDTATAAATDTDTETATATETDTATETATDNLPLHLAITLGPTLTLSPILPTLHFALRTELHPAFSTFFLAADATLAPFPTTQDDPLDPLDRWSTSLALLAGVALHPLLKTAAGIAGVLAFVHATETPGAAPIARLRPAVVGRGTLAFPVSTTVALRFDVALTFFPLTDDYLVSDRVVARSPRLTLDLGAGAGWTF